MPPVVLKTRGVKAAFSTFKTLELYFLFFSILWLMYIAGILLDALDEAIGWNTLISTNALANGDQKFLALTSSLASPVTVPAVRCSPVTFSKTGSTWTSLQMLWDISISAVTSLRLLFRRETKHLFYIWVCDLHCCSPHMNKLRQIKFWQIIFQRAPPHPRLIQLTKCSLTLRACTYDLVSQVPYFLVHARSRRKESYMSTWCALGCFALMAAHGARPGRAAKSSDFTALVFYSSTSLQLTTCLRTLRARLQGS